MLRTTFALTLLLSLAIITGAASAAESPRGTELRSDVVERLDAILKRLDGIEQRLANLEATNWILTKWTVDDRGIMRSLDGRPVGYWGVDGPRLQIQPLR